MRRNCRRPKRSRGFMRWALTMLTLEREDENVADGALIGQQHDQPVNADADAGGRRHAVFKGANEIPIGLGDLFVSRSACGDLCVEARALIVWIVELGKGIGDLHSAAEEFVTVG